ncbi:MAG: signal recognition particle-docking protein FtsY [Nitrospinae bacterium]|nr:signal recognition particle-docking protein FtsY [Nitrospinota bacterium]
MLSRLKKGLGKTAELLAGRLVALATGRKPLSDAVLQEVEEALITSDVGLRTSRELVAALKSAHKKREISTTDEIRPFLRSRIQSLVTVNHPRTPPDAEAAPRVILMVGVNGAGKTTTIGKLASRLTGEGKKVLVAAGDTFRAAAVEQLAQWCARAGCEIVRHPQGADPSAVVFDALKAGVARGKDVVIVDTAGRLHTRSNLMDELKKVRRIIAREVQGAPHETLLVVDGTTGQNTINQVREFNANIGLSGVVITKLDGTAKGGAVVGIVNETGIPVKYVGVGEGVEDLQDFDPAVFAEAII